MEAAPHPWPALGVLLLRDGLVSKEELDEILTEQHDGRQRRVSGHRLGEILIQRGRVTPTQVARLVAEQYELPFVDFDLADIDLRVATLLREEDARRFAALTISRRADGTYLLAIADPGTVLFSEELRALLGAVPRFAVVGPDAIERAIDYVYSQPVVLEGVHVVEPDQEDVVVLDFPSAGTFTRAFEDRDLEVPTSDTAPLLGALLVRDGFLGAGELEAALAQQRLTPHRRLGEILVERGIVTPSVIARLVAEQYELRYFDLAALDVDPAVASRLPADVARRLLAVPIAEHEDGSLDVAVSDPTVATRSDELQRALGTPFTIVMASPEAILALLDDVQAPAFAPVLVEPVRSPETGDAREGEAPTEIASAEADTTGEPTEPVEPVEPLLTAGTDTAVEAEPSPETTPGSTEDETDVLASRIEFTVVEPESTEIDHHEPTRDASTSDVLGVPVESADDPLVNTPSSEAAVYDEDLEPWSSAAGETAGAGAPSRWRIVDEPEADHADDDEAAGSLDWSWEGVAQPSPVEAGPWTVGDETAVELEAATEPPVVEEEPTPPVELLASVADEESAPPVDLFSPVTQEEPAWLSRLELVDEVAPDAETDEPEAYDDTFFELPFMAVHDVAEEPPRELVGGPAHEMAEDLLAELADEPVEPVEAVVLRAADRDVLAFEPVSSTSEDEPERLEQEQEHERERDREQEQEQSGAARVAALDDALAAGATTLHFSPAGQDFSVRARIDGAVTELGTFTQDERDAVLARLEANGIVRTYTATTSRGEKTTVFVRDRSSGPKALDDLSSDPTVAEAIRAALSLGSGAILVCGPPGSGTTTTLYAAVQELATPERIVTTVEHPVERALENVDQIDVDPAQGATYASVLHAVRLTDPDVLMVGDVFDRETAEIALREAREGRLVLAGFHAPSAAGAIRRLTELGVEPSVLASSLDCIVAQRLVRPVCPDCSDTYYASEDEFELLGLDDDEGPRLLSRGTGCETCGGTGLLGRTAVFEVMTVTDEIRELVADGSSPKKIQRAAVSGGMRTLRDEGVRLCLEGTTSVSELERALGL